MDEFEFRKFLHEHSGKIPAPKDATYIKESDLNILKQSVTDIRKAGLRLKGYAELPWKESEEKYKKGKYDYRAEYEWIQQATMNIMNIVWRIQDGDNVVMPSESQSISRAIHMREIKDKIKIEGDDW